MTTNRFLTLVGGVQRLVTAIAASAGAGDANKIIATGSDGRISPTFLPPGVALQTESMVTSEALGAGDFVNIFDNAGTRSARKADASNGRPAHGYTLVAVASGQTATVYKSGSNSALTGLTVGQIYFLSATTAGAKTATAPSSAGQFVQVLGYADSANSIMFEFDDPIFID
jgi:hypothetical protein